MQKESDFIQRCFWGFQKFDLVIIFVKL